MNKIYCMIYMSRQQRTCYIGIRRQELFSIQNAKISKIFIYYYYFFGYKILRKIIYLVELPFLAL